MDKQQKSDKKSNVKYQKLTDDSQPPLSSQTSWRSNHIWFQKYFRRFTGPQYEPLKTVEEEEKQSKNKNEKK